jgi:hypothetical protein
MMISLCLAVCDSRYEVLPSTARNWPHPANSRSTAAAIRKVLPIAGNEHQPDRQADTARQRQPSPESRFIDSLSKLGLNVWP